MPSVTRINVDDVPRINSATPRRPITDANLVQRFTLHREWAIEKYDRHTNPSNHCRITQPIDLSGLDASDHDLRDVLMPGLLAPAAKMSGCNLEGSDLRSTHGPNIILTHVKADRSAWDGSELMHANLNSASFRYCSMRDVQMQRSYLRGAEFIGTNLSDSDLSFSDIYMVDFRYANLQRVNLTACDGNNSAMFEGADLDGAIVPRQMVSRNRSFFVTHKMANEERLCIQINGDVYACERPGAYDSVELGRIRPLTMRRITLDSLARLPTLNHVQLRARRMVEHAIAAYCVESNREGSRISRQHESWEKLSAFAMSEERKEKFLEGSLRRRVEV